MVVKDNIFRLRRALVGAVFTFLLIAPSALLAQSATINVTIDLDNYAGETTWTLDSPSGQVGSGGPYTNPDDIISRDIVVTESGMYTFTINDSYGDGMSYDGANNENGTARYRIQLDGTTEYASSSFPNFGTSEDQIFTVTVSGGGSSDLIGHWTFDSDGSDSSTNNFDGTLSGNASINNSTYKVGTGSIALDGVNDYLELSPHFAILGTLYQGTIAAWIKTSDVVNTQTIFGVADMTPPANSFGTFGLYQGKLMFDIMEGTYQLSSNSNAIVADGSWHHVAVTVDATGNHLYIDGNQLSAGEITYLYGSNSSTTAFFSSVSVVDAVQIGVTGESGGYAYDYNGLIDDVQVYNYALSALDISALANPTSPPIDHSGTLLYDHFGVELLLQAPHSGGTNYSFDWNSFVPTLNTGTANFIESDWYGDWNFTDFGDGTETIQHAPAPGTADMDFYPSGDEPYDVEAIYFDDDNTNLYVVVVTSFPHYVAEDNDVGLVDPRISSDAALVRPGDLSLSLFDGTPRIERNNSEWHYNYGVDVTHENRDNIITVGTYQTRGMRDNNLGNKLYKTGYDAGGSNILNPANSDWYTSLIDGVVESCWNHTSFDPFSTQSTPTLSYKGEVTVDYYEYDFGGGLEENGAPTYIYEYTIPRTLLGDDDPCTNDPVGVRWVEGCRNDGNETDECVTLTGTSNQCNITNATIGNFVWNDTDQDGIQDAGETGLNNVTVKLYNSVGTLIATDITDASGLYSFTDVVPGNYYLDFILPSGYSFSPQNATGDALDSDANSSTGLTASTSLVAGENDDTWDAGMYLTPTPSCPDNLISNSGFESGLTGWDTNGGNTTLVTDSHTGTNAARLDGSNTSFTQTVAGAPGNEYTFTVWAKATNDVTFSNVGLGFYTGSWSLIESAKVEVSGDAWAEYSVTHTAPTGTVYVLADSYKEGSAGYTTVDNFCVTEEVGGPAPTHPNCDYLYAVADAGDILVYMPRDGSAGATTIGGNNATLIEATALSLDAQTLYAANANQLGVLNWNTGNFTARASTFGTGGGEEGEVTFSDVDGLAFDPLSGILYGTHRWGDGTPEDLLLQINPATGAHIPNAFGSGIDYVVIDTFDEVSLYDIDDIAISPVDGQMYGVINSSGGSDRIARINKYTGDVEDVGRSHTATADVNDVEGLAFHNSGTFYGVTGATSTMYEIDVTNALFTLVHTMDNSGDYESVAGLTCGSNLITGNVFIDTDQDGVNDVGESGQQSALVKLYRDVNNDGLVDGGDIFAHSIYTDSNGDYEFEVGTDGAFVLEIDQTTLPAGAVMSTDNKEEADFVNWGNTDPNNDFGYYIPDTINPPSSPTCDTGSSILWENNIEINGETVTHDVGFSSGSTTTFTIPGPYPSAFNGSVDVTISEAISWDGYSNRSATGEQPNERFRVVFKKSGSVVWSSPYTGVTGGIDGIDTGVESDEWVGPLGTTTNLPNGADEIILVHWSNATYGENDQSNANSVVPSSVCIGYEADLPETCPGNLLSNPGFESGNTDWNLTGKAGAQTVDVYSGTYAMAAKAYGVFYQDLPAQVGYTYYLSVWAHISEKSNAWVGMYFLDSGGSEIVDVQLPIDVIGTYANFTKDYIAPAGAVTVRVYGYSGDAETNTIMTDEFCLTEEAPTLGTIGDYIWNDEDADGVQDAGEPGMDNVTVELYLDNNNDGIIDGGDTHIGQATTSGGGLYDFTGLSAGDYLVTVSDDNNVLTNYNLTGGTDPHDVTLSAGEDYNDADFGYYDYDPTGYIYDEATGEIVSGGLIEVTGPGAVTIVHDGSSGYYEFYTDGTAGTYTIALTVPPGYLISTDCLPSGTFDPTGGPHPTVLGSGEAGSTGFLEDYTCGNNTFYYTFDLAPADPEIMHNNFPLKVDSYNYDFGDLPSPYPTLLADNGPRHPLLGSGDTKMGINKDGWETNGQPNLNATGDDFANTADEDGVTFVTSLHPGRNAQVNIYMPAIGSDGYVNAWIDFNTDGDFDDAGERIATDFFVEYGETNSIVFAVPSNATGREYSRFRITKNSGEVTTYTGAAPNGEVEDYSLGSIGNFVWIDSDTDGIQDAGEVGLSGVVINLLDGGNNPYLDADSNPITTTTDTNGYYEFPGLPANEYIVEVDLPNGYEFSPQNQGTDDAKDSDANITSGRTHTIEPSPYTSYVFDNVDVGLISLGTIGDYVWHDENSDANQNDGGASAGLEAVKLSLFDGTNTKIAETYTDANGWYAFTGLLPDDYTIIVDDATVPSEYPYQTHDYDGLVSLHAAEVTLSPNETNLQIDFGYSDTPLPVTLTSFNVEKVLNGVKLIWVTESEIENQGFIIERRVVDANDSWNEIASFITDTELKGQGTVTYSTNYEYVDQLIIPGNTYEYRLGDVDYNGVITYHATETVTIELSDNFGAPETFSVKPAYPNPFNPSTIIEYGLPESGQVSVSIYDILGHSIKTLVNQNQSAGWHSISWYGTDDNGVLVPAGMYFGIIITEFNKKTMKLMFIK